MSPKKHLPASIAGIVVVFALFAGCVASGGKKSSEADADAEALTTPTATPASPKPGPPSKALGYTVTSVKGKREGGRNCVIARVKIANHGRTRVEFGRYSRFPSPFTLVSATGREIRSAKRTLVIDWGVLPGGEDTGSISFCASGIANGDRVTLHQGRKRWKVRIPEPKPKHTVKPPPAPSKQRGGHQGGGAYPGYTGPRCYAPGGKTWRPC
ncbi:hypothetical protein [Actinomadura chibensis]|uniref:hypothetical protein n=1 Tax=Actinomadura chibensis TaxID=392828 RepID=UPI000AE6E919|nr:hypothetical protein [Actinomadura chibensis]